jgi:hypothetical protein
LLPPWSDSRYPITLPPPSLQRALDVPFLEGSPLVPLPHHMPPPPPVQCALDVPFLEGSLLVALSHHDAATRRQALLLLAAVRRLANALIDADAGEPPPSNPPLIPAPGPAAKQTTEFSDLVPGTSRVCRQPTPFTVTTPQLTRLPPSPPSRAPRRAPLCRRAPPDPLPDGCVGGDGPGCCGHLLVGLWGLERPVAQLQARAPLGHPGGASCGCPGVLTGHGCLARPHQKMGAPACIAWRAACSTRTCWQSKNEWVLLADEGVLTPASLSSGLG